MPIKHAAMKAMRQAKKATLANKDALIKLSGLKNRLKKALVAKSKEEYGKLVIEWQKACDKAAKAGIIKKNAANRYKSGWMKKILK